MVNGRNETILVFYEFGSSQETIALRFDRLLWLEGIHGLKPVGSISSGSVLVLGKKEF